jgi:hypothetical protein
MSAIALWENLRADHSGSVHYSVLKLTGDGMEALRTMFPDGNADEMNAVLFSTSGVHGTYNTIEEAEAGIASDDAETDRRVTFLVLHPRLVSLRYGSCEPKNADDIAFLKRLRESSHKALSEIGVSHA